MFFSTQTNSYLREKTVKVLSCDKVEIKEKVNKKTVTSTKYHILTDDSIFFDGSAGQSADCGTMDNVRCVGKERNDKGTLHIVDSPFAVGTEVKLVLDWEYRYENMQQHTSQHLFSGIAFDLFGLPTIGWSLHDDRTFVELQMKKTESSVKVAPEDSVCFQEGFEPVFMKDILRMESAVNNAIREQVPVTLSLIDDRSQLEKFPKLRSRGNVPKEGTLRIVTIGDYDSSTCCGTHVNNTAEIQTFCILLNSFERSRGGSLRLAFLSGSRVVKAFANAQQREIQIGSILSCSADESVSRISTAVNTSIAQAKQIKRLEETISVLISKDLVSQLPQDEKEKTKVISLHVDASGTEILQLIVSKVEEQTKLTNFVLFLTATEGTARAGSFVVFSPNQTLVKDVLPLLLTNLKGKGGGKGTKVQGKAEEISEETRKKATDAIAELLTKN